MTGPDPMLLRELLEYRPETGRFFWKPRTPDKFPSGYRITPPEKACALWNARYAGKEAFKTKNKKGYRATRVMNHMLLAHRVAWAIMTGKWPDEFIDHRNGDPGDNRWENIREATHPENMRNRRSDRHTTSKYRGVSKLRSKWRVGLGRTRYIGIYETEEEAARAYDRAARTAYGEFARPNFPEGE